MNDDTLIRPARADDLPTVLALLEEAALPRDGVAVEFREACPASAAAFVTELRGAGTAESSD